MRLRETGVSFTMSLIPNEKVKHGGTRRGWDLMCRVDEMGRAVRWCGVPILVFTLSQCIKLILSPLVIRKYLRGSNDEISPRLIKWTTSVGNFLKKISDFYFFLPFYSVWTDHDWTLAERPPIVIGRLVDQYWSDRDLFREKVDSESSANTAKTGKAANY